MAKVATVDTGNRKTAKRTGGRCWRRAHRQHDLGRSLLGDNCLNVGDGGVHQDEDRLGHEGAQGGGGEAEDLAVQGLIPW